MRQKRLSRTQVPSGQRYGFGSVQTKVVLQSSPLQPRLQTQNPSSQTPFPLQLFKQVLNWQASPVQPTKQRQPVARQVPLPLQSSGQLGPSLQSKPL